MSSAEPKDKKLVQPPHGQACIRQLGHVLCIQHIQFAQREHKQSCVVALACSTQPMCRERSIEDVGFKCSKVVLVLVLWSPWTLGFASEITCSFTLYISLEA
jgi:hypothetical protein